jgi:DNA polymerase
LKDALNSSCPVYAHNADFERQIFDYVMENDFGLGVDIKRWRCSMVQALTNGLPAKLDELGNALDLPVKKQPHGTRLIREYCAPNHLTEFKEGDKELMHDYARDDVVVMRYAVQSMRDLTDEEWAEYHLTCRINDRGIPVDVPFVTAALDYADDIAAEVGEKLTELTGGMMTKHTQRKGRDAWLHPRLTDEHMKLMEVWKKGKKKLSLDQEHRDILLSVNDLDDGARELLNLINDAGSAALKKYGAAANQHINGRVHNTFQFHGAQTGRFSGRGIQPHNFRRDTWGSHIEDQIERDAYIEETIDDIKNGYEIDEPSTTMARLLRAMVYSKRGISYVDWKSIEGRVAPWLSNSELGERKLDLYRADKDVYVETAAEMFNLNPDDVDKEKRQSGKISELSLQFGGGSGALQGMAKNYGVTFSDAEAERLVTLWRRSNAWAVQLWPKFERAAYSAVKNIGKPFKAELCTFQSDGNYLWCQLPSGRLLAYYAPRIELTQTPWGEERVAATFQTTIKMKQEDIKKQGEGERPFYRNALRGALLMQNATQAVAADILRRSLVRADAEGLPVILSVHDEIGVEGGIDMGEKLNRIMLEVPNWARGLPLATGGVEHSLRYGK